MENTAIKVALFQKIADNNQSYSTAVMNSEAQDLQTFEPILENLEESKDGSQ
jgi:hypothetical protein